MIAGALWMLAANAASLLGSFAAVRRMRTGSLAIDWLLVLLFRQTAISAAVLLAGTTGQLSPAGLGIPAVLTLAWLLVRRELRALEGFRVPRPGPLAIAFATVVLVRFALQVWFFSPHLGDPLAYHLPKIAEWVRAARFTREMGVHTHAPFPAGFKLIETWWVVFLRHDVLIEAAGLEYVLIGFVAVVALARRLEISPRSSMLAGFLYALVPGFHLSATSCLNDTPAAAMVVAAMALAAAHASYGFLAMAVGLGLGIKPTFGFALPGVLLLAWTERADARGRAFARGAAATGALGLAVGAFWYLRNILWYGNPFYPLGSPGFVDPTPVQFGPSFRSLAVNLANLVDFRIYDQATLYGANADYMASWGAAAFACGLLALVATAREDAAMRRVAVAFLVSLAFSLTFIQDDPWCLKYVFYFPAVLCLATAKLADATPGVSVVAGVALGFSFLGTFLPYDLRADHLEVLYSQAWRERTAAKLPYGELSLDPGDAVIGYYGGPTGAAYLLYRPDFSRGVIYLRPTTARGLVEEARGAGLRILFTPQVTPEQQGILDEAVRGGTLRNVGGRFYEVMPPS